MAVKRKSSQNFPNGTKVEALGFNSDIDSGRNLTGDFNAVIVRNLREENLVSMRADLFAGASGGPVIARTASGVPYIFAVNVRSAVDTTSGKIQQKFYPDDHLDTINSRSLTEAVTSESFYERMIKFMKENPCP